MAVRFIAARGNMPFVIDPAATRRYSSHYYATDPDSTYEDIDRFGDDAESVLGNSTATEFLEALPVINQKDLAEDPCAICHEHFTMEKGCENGVKLPCGHIMGSECIKSWVLSSAASQHATCPMCRAVLFENNLANRIASTPDIDDREDILNFMQEIEELDYRRIAINRAAQRRLDEVRSEHDRRITESNVRFERELDEVLNRHQAPPTFLENRAQIPSLNTDALLRRLPYGPAATGVLSFFHTVTTISATFRGIVDRPSEATLGALEDLSSQMGQLFTRLLPAMARMGFWVSWGSDGPGVHALMNPRMFQQLRIALERMVEVERRLVSEATYL